MKKTIRAILILSFVAALALFAFYLVRLRRENIAASLPVSGRSLDFAAESAVEGGEKRQNRTTARAKINPEYNEVFLDAFDVNLDEDEDLEQVIVAKPLTEEQTGDRLSVVIADFQPFTSSYRRLWKGETLAVKPKTFVIQPRDLLGDGAVELLCFGLDGTNRQTLTIFKPSNADKTRFKTVFSESGLSINIVDPQDTGRVRRAARIQVFEAAKDGSSPLDQTKRDFTWSSLAESYKPGSLTLIPGEKVKKDFIDRIVMGSARNFESYLDGLWEREGGKQDEAILLSFSASKREITIKGNPDLQVWDWPESSLAFVGIRSSISNGAVPDMLRLLSVDLVGVDRIAVNTHAQKLARFSPSEDWKGTYRRYTGPTEAKRTDGFIPILASDAFGIPEGKYSGSGFTLDLEGGLYHLEDRSGSKRGRYYLFRYRDFIVLNLSPYEESTDPSERRTYILFAHTEPNRGIDGIKLRLARLTSEAIIPDYKPDIELKRIVAQGSK